MWKSTKIQALALVALGAILGYLTASWDLFRRAAATPPTTSPGETAGRRAGPEKESCGAETLNKGRLLAMAALPNSAAEATAVQKGGKQPNILVIMGDDIGWFNPSCYHQG